MVVKADLTRDYYADLGLASGATEADIKKAFKKLGMSSSAHVTVFDAD
jgi:hypothetical protein